MPNDDRLMDQLVERLHACLAEAMNRSRAEPIQAPVTVAEIYQDLVPYRAVRSRLGFEMNADYEHTLLRMLAGEGNHARLEPKEARDELRAELQTPNPNVGLFRKFAGCDVWIATPREGVRVEPLAAPVAIAHARKEGRDGAPAWRPAPVAPPADIEMEWGPPPPPQLAARADPPNWAQPPELPLLADAAPLPPPPEQPELAELPAEPAAWEDDAEAPELLLEEEVVDEVDLVDELLYEMPPPEPARAAAIPQPAPAEEPVVSTTPIPVTPNGRVAMHKPSGNCAFCDSALPSKRAVKFCPFCGMDQSMHPCGSCGEALEPDWRFCAACGAQSAVPAGVT